jgi:hypothetical protein
MLTKLILQYESKTKQTRKGALTFPARKVLLPQTQASSIFNSRIVDVERGRRCRPIRKIWDPNAKQLTRLNSAKNSHTFIPRQNSLADHDMLVKQVEGGELGRGFNAEVAVRERDVGNPILTTVEATLLLVRKDVCNRRRVPLVH